MLSGLGLGLARADDAAEAARQLAEQAAATQLALLQAPTNEASCQVRRHFLWSNERRHDLYFDDIRGLGRGYLGVGADQNYTLAAAAQADVAWLVDMDAAVVSLHHLYIALIAAAPTAEEFLALLSPARERELRGIVTRHYPDARVRTKALQIYELHGPLLLRHLRRSHRDRLAGHAVTWLGDPALYAHVRKLALAERLIPRLGNLSGPRTMQQIGQAARAAHIPLRVLYLSNAESWRSYSAQLYRNLRALPLDEHSVVLRTMKSILLRYPQGDVWHFSVQGALDFVHKLGLKRYHSVNAIMADLVAPGGLQPGRPRGCSRIEPGVPDRPRDIAKGLVMFAKGK